MRTIALGLGLFMALTGCGASSQQCLRDNEQCVRRCQNAGVQDHSKEWNPANVSVSTCESQCGCGEHKQPASSTPSGRPTFTN